MNSALIKRLRKIATLEAEDYGAEPQDHSSWQAADLIESLSQQLAAALAACKLKDDALEGLIDTMDLRLDDDDLSLETRTAFEALAIQPDDSALKQWLGEQDTIQKFITAFEHHTGGNREFWLYELEAFAAAPKGEWK